jgi:hypothetical protein
VPREMAKSFRTDVQCVTITAIIAAVCVDLDCP